MIVTVMNRQEINTFSLLAKIKGQFWLYEAGVSEDYLASVEAVSDKWVLKTNRKTVILGSQKELKSVPLEPLCVYPLEKENGERVFIFTEPITEDRQTFQKYFVRDGSKLIIGRNTQSDICYVSKVVSSKHAVLSLQEGKWSVYDHESTNKTFVNNQNISKAELCPGDVIFVMGLKIIVGNGFLALNNPDGEVTVSSKLVPMERAEMIEPREGEDFVLEEGEFFYRSPRFKRDIETAAFKIDSPPNSPISEELPWFLVMGSSLAMGMMSAVTLATAIITSNITSMVMGASMLCGTVLLPTISKRYEKKKKREKEALRQREYKSYLKKMKEQIDAECRLQETVLRENHVTLKECEDRIMQRSRTLWERAPGQNDFLRVRLGVGDGALDANISYSERRFSLESDNLQEELYKLCESEKRLESVPITYSLFDNYISGVIGKRARVAPFAKGLIMQLAALYSYDEVKFVFLFDSEERSEFEFVKWLPHVWSEDGRFRFVATNANEMKEVSAFFEKEVEQREAVSGSERNDISPYYIFFAFSKKLSVRSELMKKLFAQKENICISTVSFCEELKDLPKECSMVVELGEQRGKLYDKNDMSGKTAEFVPDLKLKSNPLELSVCLANTKLDSAEGKLKLPAKLTFLEMFDAGKVEHLNALTRWKENDPTKSLETPVGVNTYGEVFLLDLHEKFHGPHGLIAGMTGSGKSEFIITYILSLAVNYHPEEVAFILIDYKGGGMAKSFENLPHTAGIITNLDGAAIKRSLVSIESELKRRQTLFANAAKKIGESNVDIYKYQKLYREGVVEEPLQHLFIISDEFAELKTQQPEFMTQLVSAARIGRSLGVHLILATQKPSGVVDDQIWSNSKFKVCLKVQERADSMDMLKRPDAAALVETGRFYLQVGYNELFELGQSAWSGAPYTPADRVVKEKDTSVVVVDMNGHAIKQARIDRGRGLSRSEKKQLDIITEYLKKTAEEESIRVRPLWLEPIPAKIYLHALREKYQTGSTPYCLNPVIGEYDIPAHQRQEVLRLPITEEGNVVVYGASGSGKTTFLSTMVTSLIEEHSPEEVNLYLLDFSSETLRAFAKAPHVGEVILSYEAEKVTNLFKMLRAEIEKRKKEFSNYGGDYISYIKSSGKTLPSIVVAINNFAAFTEIYEEKEEAVAYLSREGIKYGLYFVLTAPGVGAVRFRLLQNFKQLFALQLNDETDYSSVVGKTEGLLPSKYKGRGLVRFDEVYEFQLASPTEDDALFACVQAKCKELAENWAGRTAKKIPVLPDRVNVEFLRDYIDSNKQLNLPVGVEKSTLSVHRYPFHARYINMVLSAGVEYQKFVASLVALQSSATDVKSIVFDLPGAVEPSVGAAEVFTTGKGCEEQVDKLFETILYRNNTYKEALECGEQPEEFENLFVVVNSLHLLQETLSDQGKEKLALILAKGSEEYNVNIVLAEQAKNVSSISFEKWYKEHVSVFDGLWVGNGIAEQYQIKVNKTTPEMREEITPEFGYSIINGKGVKLKLLNDGTEEEEDE